MILPPKTNPGTGPSSALPDVTEIAHDYRLAKKDHFLSRNGSARPGDPMKLAKKVGKLPAVGRGPFLHVRHIKGVEDDARQLARRIFATRCVGWAFARS
jgi:hypothetical protein